VLFDLEKRRRERSHSKAQMRFLVSRREEEEELCKYQVYISDFKKKRRRNNTNVKRMFENRERGREESYSKY
jgi:hypothetical protein